MDYQSFRKEYEQSGMTQKAFGEQKSMSPSMVHYYLKRANNLHLDNSEGSFKEVSIKQSVTRDRQITITMPDGIKISIPV